jgi:hypothetical protein
MILAGVVGATWDANDVMGKSNQRAENGKSN